MEAVTQDPHSTAPLATEARPVSVAIVAHTLATAVSATSSDSQRPPVQWGAGIPIGNRASRGSSSRAPTRTPEAYAGGPTNLDEFVNIPEFGPEGNVEDVDVDAAREPKRRKLIHHVSRRVSGRAAVDQELIVSLSNELSSAMRQLQESNVALDNCQQSKADIMKMQASSRACRTGYVRQRVLQETTARLEERERMVHNLSELNEINRLLITRYQENRRR